MGALGVLFLFLRNPLAAAFAGDARIAEDLAPFMMMLAIAQPFMGAHFTLAGVLRGSGDTVTPLVGAAVGNWGLRVPLAALASHVGAGLSWVWAALIADHFSRMMINGFDLRLRRLGQADRRKESRGRQRRPESRTSSLRDGVTPRGAPGATSRPRSRGRSCPPWP